jgi:hypothetical protein
MEGVLRCSACGDAIGTYEPVLVIEHGDARASSLAREPELASMPGKIVHRSCAEAGLAEPVGLTAERAAQINR